MDDGTVAVSPVKVAYEDAGRTVLSEGVKPGDRVVTDGQLRLAPGVKVDVKTAPGTP
jgi:multidrug efflux system membrane fusion protein